MDEMEDFTCSMYRRPRV